MLLKIGVSYPVSQNRDCFFLIVYLMCSHFERQDQNMVVVKAAKFLYLF